jgi:predicted permease
MLSDFKLAARQLAKTPGYTALAIIALALGIGANTAIFSAIQTMFLQPLGFSHPEQLVRIGQTLASRQSSLNEVPISYPRYLELRREKSGFADVGAWCFTGLTLTGRGDPEQVTAMRLTGNLLPLLGLQPAVGRNFLPEEDRKGGRATALLSYGYWQKRFGGDPAVLGQLLELNGVAVTVIGVMPRNLESPFDLTQVFLTKVFEVEGLPPELIEKGSGYLFATGRLQPGQTIASANENLKVVNARYQHDYPGRVDASASLFCLSLQEDLVGNQRPLFLVLLATVGFVLVIACSNVANLLLARFSGRRKEIAIRTALGATRSAIIRQFLAESMLTAALAGAFGLLFAVWGVDVLVRVDVNSGDAIPRLEHLGINAPVLIFALVVSLLTGIGLGIVPALQSSVSDGAEALKESTRGSTGGRSVGRFRAMLLITEVALSLVLLVGAGLMLDSFRRLQKVDPGFDPTKVALVNVALPPGQYPNADRQAEFYRQAIERLQAIAGVDCAAGTDGVPLTGNNTFSPYAVEGRALPPANERPLVLRPTVTPGYFASLGVPIKSGRDFTWRDRLGTTNVVIINAAMARRIFPGEDPIGRRLITGMMAIPRQIVGVVGDMRSLRLTDQPADEMYYPTAQAGAPFFSLLVRTQRPARSLRGEMAKAIHELDRNLPVTDPQPLSDLVLQSISSKQLAMGLLSGFAGLSLLLAGMGIYTVIAYTVAQRTNEIGIRMALGAEPREVFLMVMRQGLRLALTGLAIGLVATVGLNRLISDLLYEVSAYDPAILIGVSTFLFVVSALACAIPAWRAIRIDPLTALRADRC